MTAPPYDVRIAAGLPETVLPEAVAARLPASVAPAPWLTRDCQVISWLHEFDTAALEAIPEGARPEGAAIVAWALVRYGDTPVGPYSEIAATVMAADPDGYGHIPFIAVDSEASVSVAGPTGCSPRRWQTSTGRPTDSRSP
jgi:hypothetical protein